jgi:hypothetical protein
MTFDSAVPLNSNSPGIWPAQSQANFTRLKTLLGADHQFNDTAAANDGYHNLIHMIPQAPSGALAGFGRLYPKIVSGVVQLFYMDDSGAEYQLTPQSATDTTKVTGSATIGSGGSNTIFNVAYDFTGYGIVYINASATVSGYAFTRSGGVTYINNQFSNSTFGFFPPALSFTGTALQVSNPDVNTHLIFWSLMINRTT